MNGGVAGAEGLLTAVEGSTRVSYPAGAVGGVSPLLAWVPLPEGRYGVVVAETPFHPLDHTWPDQPADVGALEVAGRVLPVVDCVTGAVEHGGGALFLGPDIPVRRGADGWDWLVVHICDAPEKPVTVPPAGEKAELRVDESLRAALSAGHTACHLAALALNAALAGRWRKDASPDALGSPDFDQTAIVSSHITPRGSRDVYRLGKSLRKKGFVSEGLDDQLEEVAAEANGRLAAWTAANAAVWVDSPGPELTARRTWRCALPEGEAAIPCGGTHVRHTGELGTVTITLDLSPDATSLTMHTSTTP